MLVAKLCIIDAKKTGTKWGKKGGRNASAHLETPDCIYQLLLGAERSRFQIRLGQIIKLHEVIVLQAEMYRYIREVCQRYLNSPAISRAATMAAIAIAIDDV